MLLRVEASSVCRLLQKNMTDVVGFGLIWVEEQLAQGALVSRSTAMNGRSAMVKWRGVISVLVCSGEKEASRSLSRDASAVGRSVSSESGGTVSTVTWTPRMDRHGVARRAAYGSGLESAYGPEGLVRILQANAGGFGSRALAVRGTSRTAWGRSRVHRSSWQKE